MAERAWVPVAAYTGHKSAVYALCPDGPDHFLSAGGDGLVVHWERDRTEEGDALVDVGEAVFSLCALPELGLLLIGTGTGRLVVIDRRTRQEVQAITAHAKGIFRITPLPGAGTIACAGGDGVLSTWDLVDDRARPLSAARRIPLCEEKLRDVVVSPNGERVVVACGDGSLRELDLPALNECQRFDRHERGANSVMFHPDKPVLISGGKDGLLKVWRADGGLLLDLAAHKGSIYCAAPDPTGRTIVTAGRDALVKVWGAQDLAPIRRSGRERNAHTHSVNTMLWSGTTLLTGSDDRTIKAWRIDP
ncbi:MAG: hypothetical protein R2815_06185 [Flavobacteriales bacterium]